jgi:hypothetical protein
MNHVLLYILWFIWCIHGALVQLCFLLSEVFSESVANVEIIYEPFLKPQKYVVNGRSHLEGLGAILS